MHTIATDERTLHAHCLYMLSHGQLLLPGIWMHFVHNEMHFVHTEVQPTGIQHVLTCSGSILHSYYHLVVKGSSTGSSQSIGEATGILTNRIQFPLKHDHQSCQKNIIYSTVMLEPFL